MHWLLFIRKILLLSSTCFEYYYYYYYYWYSALGPVCAETRAQSGDWYDSGTLHPGQVLRGSLPLLSPPSLYAYVIMCMLCACFSICFSSRNPKKATELTEEPPPAHSKWDIRLNTSICLSFMYVTCKTSTDSLELIDNLIVSPDTSTLSMANCADWLEYRIKKLLDWNSDGLSACCQWRNDQCRMSPHEF